MKGSLRQFVTRCLLLITLCWTAPALAQLRSEPPADPLHVGQRVNAFVEWAGSEPLAGIRVEVPAGWQLHDVVATSEQVVAPVRLAVTRQDDGDYVVSSERSLHGPLRLVVGLTVGEELGYREVTFVPLGGAALEPGLSWSTRWGGYVGEALPRESRALQLTEAGEPVVLRRHALPSLDPRNPSTLEFWLKTVGLDEIVLSTWDGDENRPYPLEVVVDGQGRLAAYRGRPGAHERLRTPRPIADGQWHHVALIHDPEAGWSRLYVDGNAADSLRTLDLGGAHNTLSLALGGRPLRPGQPHRRLFSGHLDEVRLWPQARSVVALRRMQRLPLEEPPVGVLRLGFEERLPEELLVQIPSAPVRVRSDLSFVFPVEALEAAVERGMVALTWQTKDRRVEAFEVERSADGQVFQAVATVRADAGAMETASGALRFSYTDLPPEGQVLYYRVRQRSASGPERVSGVLKLGLGVPEEPDEVAIVGNSPNPFRTSTLITYELARPQPVRLSVWDLSGTRVATLVDAPMPAGEHSHRFEPEGLPSGVYFVRLQTPSGNATHKVTLAK